MDKFQELHYKQFQEQNFPLSIQNCIYIKEIYFQPDYCLQVNNNLPLLHEIHMKCSELLRILKKDGWYKISQSGSHAKLKHCTKPGILIFPDHGSQELGKGMENKIKKDAGLK